MIGSEEPRKACVMGHRVAYSRSPMIHNHWLRTLGIPGSYDLVDIEPGRFPQFLRNLRAEGFVGGNVTIPHKDLAFRLVDAHDDAAQAIGAVNTVWVEGNKLFGGNTDAIGFLANLDESAPGWDRGGPAVVIGAGGAARAVVHALLGREFRVALVNRSPERADELVNRFGKNVRVHRFADLGTLLPEARMLINASPLGAAGQPELKVDLALLNPESIVCDLNYVPVKTRLLERALAHGYRIADGLGMLLHQAAPAFRKWFGVMPPVTADLRALVAADIIAKVQ
jgi:shikimate dehydrogenase